MKLLIQAIGLTRFSKILTLRIAQSPLAVSMTLVVVGQGPTVELPKCS